MQWIIDHARHLLLIWACLLMFGFGLFGLDVRPAYADVCSEICAAACDGHGGCVGSTEAGSTCRIGCNDGSLFEVPAV